LYIDADFSAATGYKQWIYDASGIDYLVQGPNLSKFTGPAGSGDWSFNDQVGTATRAYSADARSAELSLALADFTSVTLGNVWGVVLPYYYSGYTNTDPVFFPAINWEFNNTRKVFVVKERSEVSLDNVAELVSSNAYYYPFMKDENIADYLDFQSTGAIQNSVHWASWVVNLSAPSSSFNLKMTIQSTGSGKIELWLVDVATNEVVKSFYTGDGNDKWYPDFAVFTEHDFYTLDWSDVPAGKYMLKLINPSNWETFLKVSKVTLTNLNPISSISPVNAENVTVKTSENGFSLTSENVVNVSVYSVEGKLISTYKQVKSVNGQLQSGLYLISIQSGNQQITKKIIVK
jgi:hypothetical protein